MNFELTLVPSAAIEKESDHKFKSAGEWLDAFSGSPEFEAARKEREGFLKKNRPDVDYDSKDGQQIIDQSLEGSQQYVDAMLAFYNQGNKLDFDRLSEDAQSAIREYWNYILFLRRHLPVVRREYADDNQILVSKVIELDRQRDRRHVVAAYELLKEYVAQKSNNTFEERTDMSDAQVKIGRHLVMYLTEDRGLDKADPQRELKKAQRDFENMKNTPAS